MKTLLSGLMAAALAVSFAAVVPAPTNAAPAFVPKVAQGRTDLQQAAHTYRHWKRQQRRAERRAERRAYRRYARDRCYYYGDCYRGRNYGRYYGRNYGFGPRYYRRPGVTLRFDL
ncbi:hypothetical protein RB623_11330 [Mesorhizobium sp. LHD-90]|uniref:hypothetical protein n=1 Tax=Mesorhizobium sp. LHD-90 TaxID=3071414 RepID=UPI0027DEE61B|nr:hypothetical protein [Mesorhizobium sp. LHD-90]MDQ6434637.1 hypothetical protein [Mesorhizobium sp. LHD-90]